MQPEALVSLFISRPRSSALGLRRSILKLLASGNISEGDIFMLLAEASACLPGAVASPPAAPALTPFRCFRQVVFILCSIGALAVYFRRLWAKRELQAQVRAVFFHASCLFLRAHLPDLRPTRLVLMLSPSD